MDKLTPAQRSQNMARIKSNNTQPELAVRSVLWNLGYRYRLHIKKLPGKPDIYLSKLKTAVFINGCFWHQHKNCKRNFMPKSRVEYWKPKLERNVKRLAEQIMQLESQNIKVITIWECEAKDINKLRDTVKERLGGTNPTFQNQTAISLD